VFAVENGIGTSARKRIVKTRRNRLRKLVSTGKYRAVQRLEN
jgi:hypothetical protein